MRAPLGRAREAVIARKRSDSESRPPTGQAQLVIGPAETAEEHEADRLAYAISGVPSHHDHDASGAAPEIAPELVETVLRSPGRPLEDEARRFFELRFGRDLNHVRIHRDASAARSARAIGASAYSVGPHIVLGTHESTAATPEGRRLLAHELTHVVQHAGVGRLVHRDIPPSMAPAARQIQRPYYRIDDIIADLHRAAAALARTPADFDLAKAIVRSAYQWLDGFITSGRAEVAFRGRIDPSSGFQLVWDARNAVGEMFGSITRAQLYAGLRGERPSPRLLEVELQRVDFARPFLAQMEEAVSFELAESRSLPDVPTRFARLTRSQQHVLAWLVQHRPEITRAAARFRIDRRAVAGAIAWEATEQVKTSSIRAVGPGKPHGFEFRGKSAAEEAEELGYLPRMDWPGRKRLLESIPSAVEYIAGIMAAHAGIAERFGITIRNDPGVLATVYHGWTPRGWEAHLAEKQRSTPYPWPRPVVANPMGIWVEEHLPYLEEAVGFTAAEETASGEAPHRATPAGTTLRM